MMNAEGHIITSHNGVARRLKTPRILNLTALGILALFVGVLMLPATEASAQSRRDRDRSRDDSNDRGYVDPDSQQRRVFPWDNQGSSGFSNDLRDSDRRRSNRRNTSSPTPSVQTSGEAARGVAQEAQVVTGDQNQNQPGPPQQQPGRNNRQGITNNNPARFNPNGQPGRGGAQQPPPMVKKGFPTFHFQPVEPMAYVGEEFDLNLVLSNDDEEPFDYLRVAIRYDPQYLEVVGPYGNPENARVQSATEIGIEFDQSAESGFANRVDPSRGIIYYGGPVQGEQAIGSGRFALVRFRTLQETTRPSELHYLFERDVRESVEHPALTKLTLGDKDVLGVDMGQGGAVSADVRIRFEDEADKPEIGDSRPEKPIDGEYPTRLLFLPDKRQVAVGEEFNVAVLLYNPPGAAVTFDELSLLIRYDPYSLQLTSLDNLVGGQESTRLRVDRGDFRFDQMQKNRVDPENGLIHFRARATRNSLSESGRIMTLRFKALTPVDETRLRFGVNRQFNHPTTGLFERNQDRLANPLLPDDGIFTSGVAIVPTSEG